MSALPHTPEEWKKMPLVLKEILRAIKEDDWMFIAVWGQNRTGKSNLCLKLAYYVYQDWDDVLNCVTFQFNNMFYNIIKGIPVRFPTANGLHNRVPVTILDDAGAHNNKAVTRFSNSVDLIKGAIDTLGTHAACILANMLTPDELTMQLGNKLTHEIYIPERGIAKYDKVAWIPDYYGWRPNKRKTWAETWPFTPIPADIYKEYDERRQRLSQELFTRINDIMMDQDAARVIRRLVDADFQLLDMLKDGPVNAERVTYSNIPNYSEVVDRNKGRELILSYKRKNTAHSYRYTLTPFGEEIVNLLEGMGKLANATPVVVTWPTKKAEEEDSPE